MQILTTVVGLLLVLTLFSALLRQLSVPSSTVMVLLGAGIAFIPGMPDLRLTPELVLLIFLPALIYSHAWYVTWHEFRGEALAIASMAVLLVVVTMGAVAAAAHAVVPGLSWGIALTLGAILAPTDGTAASSIAHRMGLPRRLVMLIEGEGLISESTAIVAFRVAVAAVLTGTFSITDALTSAAVSTVGGLAVGLAAGWLVLQVHRVTADPRLETVMTILTPFVAYLPAEWMHLSAVLAVVSAGLFVGYHQALSFTAETRLQAIAVWDVIKFLLNGMLFILIGLQLPSVLEGVAGYGAQQLALYAGVVCAAVVVTRLAWLYLGAGVERVIHKARPLSAAAATVVGWAGMRGAISLAAVLSLPTALSDGTPFPHRDLLAFLVFAVILFSLVLQSLSLPMVIRASGLCPQEHQREQVEQARLQVANAVVKSLHGVTRLPLPVVRAVADDYRNDARRLRLLADASPEELRQQRDRDDATVHALRVERETLMQMKQRGEINDETLHCVLRDTDLREARQVRRIRASVERTAEVVASPPAQKLELHDDRET